MPLTTLFHLAFRSLSSRASSAILTVLAIAVSVCLFLGVENLRQGARDGFDQTVSGVDLIVGARTSPANLVLYTVFRIGEPTAEIRYRTYEELRSDPEIAWAAPVALGDSLNGYRVIGTTRALFDHFRTGDSVPLSLREGRVFADTFEIVLGAEAARGMGSSLGDEKVLSHGISETTFQDHDNITFEVVGILAPTGTPMDQSVFVPMEGITAMHEGWVQGTRTSLVNALTEDMLRELDLTPATVTAVFVGLKNRTSIRTVQRAINTSNDEPLVAVIPALALAQLWQVVSVVERALAAVGAFVVVVGLISIVTTLLSSLRERRREMALLRAVGARGRDVFTLLISEAALIAFAGAVIGLALAQSLTFLLAPFARARFGIQLASTPPGMFELLTVLGVVVIAALLALLPAAFASRRAVQDGLSISL